LFGRRQYLPDDALSRADPRNPTRNFQTPLPAIRGKFRRGAPNNGIPVSDDRGNQVWLALDENGRTIIDRQNGVAAYVPFDQDLRGLFNDYFNFGTGDNEPVPLNPYTRTSFQTKLSYKPTDLLKLAYSLNFENEEFQDYDHGWQLNPDGELKRFRRSWTNFLSATYTLSNSSFIETKISNFNTNTRLFAFENPFDPRYQDPQQSSAVTFQQNFTTGGTKNDRFDRTTNTVEVKVDFTSQIDKYNLVKIGGDVKFHTLDYEYALVQDLKVDGVALSADGFQPSIYDAQTDFGHDIYTRKPREYAAYIQDKIEFSNFIINVGLRFDAFDPNSVVPRYSPDPSTFFSFLDDVEYARRNGLESKLIGDSLPSGERFVPTTIKYAVSPRLGVSFPVTDRGKFYFSVGQFFQLPDFSLLYENALYKFREADAGGGIPLGPFGNPDIRPQRTFQGEIGLQQQIGESVGISISAYYRDIRDLAGSAFTRLLVNGGTYLLYENTDYAYVRGITLSVTKRLSSYFNFTLDYTFQNAQGNSPDPRTAAFALQGGQEVETQLTALTWDQQHTLNGTFNFETSEWNVSLIGRFGSGFPFTPTPIVVATGGGVPRYLQNAGRRPATYSLDLRASRSLAIAGVNVNVFVQVFNLLDTPNELTVFGETGRAGYTLFQPGFNPENQLLNPLSDFTNRQEFFSEPRRITVGTSFNF
jgi:hypothetical protein